MLPLHRYQKFNEVEWTLIKFIFWMSYKKKWMELYKYALYFIPRTNASAVSLSKGTLPITKCSKCFFRTLSVRYPKSLHIILALIIICLLLLEHSIVISFTYSGLLLRNFTIQWLYIYYHFDKWSKNFATSQVMDQLILSLWWEEQRRSSVIDISGRAEFQYKLNSI